MLNRLVQAKRDALAGPKVRRPHLASEVDSLSECEKWRGQIIRQIAKEVSIIQNAALGEHKIRDLNDRINKLMREKRAWEHQIKALGGNDYIRDGIRVTDSDGKRAVGSDVRTNPQPTHNPQPIDRSIDCHCDCHCHVFRVISILAQRVNCPAFEKCSIRKAVTTHFHTTRYTPPSLPHCVVLW